jgi:uncharacterized protein YtpQ (UPF0354 family)
VEEAGACAPAGLLPSLQHQGLAAVQEAKDMVYNLRSTRSSRRTSDAAGNSFYFSDEQDVAPSTAALTTIVQGGEEVLLL